MKIALIITRLDKGGSADVVLTIFQRLVKDGFDTTLIYGLTKDAPDVFAVISRSLKEKIVYMPTLRRAPHLFWDSISLVKLITILRQGSFDIVHTHSSKAGFIGRLAAKLAGVPRVVHAPHGHIFYGYFGRVKTTFFIALEKLSALYTDKIITLTERGKLDHVRYGIAPADKFVPIYCGVELERFLQSDSSRVKERKRWNIGPDDVVVGMAARLVPIKGCEFFIRAIPVIIRELPKVRFLIAGDGYLRDSLEKISHEIGVTDSLNFMGNQSDMPSVMSIFDISVVPSVNEGLGRVIIEAMASGKSVVATRVGGIPEIVAEGVTGFLVEPKNKDALAQAIIRLVRDAALRESMGEKGRERAKELFDAERMIEKTERVYASLPHSKKM